MWQYRAHSKLPGGIDEEWFILISCRNRAEGRAGFGRASPLLSTRPKTASRRLEALLTQVEAAMGRMHATLLRMPECCDPLRLLPSRRAPYIHGWKNHPDLPAGLFMKACMAVNRSSFAAKPARQSAIVPALDAMLGVSHQRRHSADVSAGDADVHAARAPCLYRVAGSARASSRLRASRRAFIADCVYDACVERLIRSVRCIWSTQRPTFSAKPRQTRKILTPSAPAARRLCSTLKSIGTKRRATF